MKDHETVTVRDGQESEPLVLAPVMNIELAKRRLEEFQGFVRGYLVEGEDYGTIPGTPKPTLLKPGADKLCELYGLADEYELVTQVERFDAVPMLFDYTVKCVLKSRRDGRLVATGLGSCNSYEGKFRWREGSRVCPDCQNPTIIKGKEEFGGGWICFAKKGGCGAKFPAGDASIESQLVGRIPNDDIATLKNTILKMAKKRAKVDATLGATRSSGIFTQEVEDIQSVPTIPLPRRDAPKAPQKTLDLFVQIGATETIVSGATYFIKTKLNNLGARFDENYKAWKIPSARVPELVKYCGSQKIKIVELDEEGLPVKQGNEAQSNRKAEPGVPS